MRTFCPQRWTQFFVEQAIVHAAVQAEVDPGRAQQRGHVPSDVPGDDGRVVRVHPVARGFSRDASLVREHTAEPRVQRDVQPSQGLQTLTGAPYVLHGRARRRWTILGGAHVAQHPRGRQAKQRQQVDERDGAVVRACRSLKTKVKR